MTDEQIKQKADNYTESLMCENLHRTMYSSIDFIAGAHSLDKEIEELQNELESLRKGFYERGDKLKELMLANNKLHNPWISVEDRLPELNVRVLILNKNGLISISRRKYDKRRGVDTDWEWVDSWHWANWQKHITHWMPIPELKN